MPNSCRDFTRTAAWSSTLVPTAPPNGFAAVAAKRPLRILALGGSGFIGSHQIAQALAFKTSSAAPVVVEGSADR